MLINGYDYHFAYTTGAYCDIYDLHLAPVKTMPEQCKVITQMAVIMSKAYEDRKKVEDPSYKPRYLTMAEVRSLSIQDTIDKLVPEVDGAVAEGKYRSVESEPVKNAEGTVSQ